jgi:hypothetical protein
MAKGQQRSNREKKKPKADKNTQKAAASGSAYKVSFAKSAPGSK